MYRNTDTPSVIRTDIQIQHLLNIRTYRYTVCKERGAIEYLKCQIYKEMARDGGKLRKVTFKFLTGKLVGLTPSLVLRSSPGINCPIRPATVLEARQLLRIPSDFLFRLSAVSLARELSLQSIKCFSQPSTISTIRHSSYPSVN